MKNQYKKTKNIISLINYHFVFCPRYRRKILIGEVEIRFKQLIYDICSQNGWDILAMQVNPDHCYLFISCLPTDSPSGVMAKIKGLTSRQLRGEFQHLTHLPSLWTRNYFVSTQKDVSKDIIESFVKKQKIRG